MQLLQQMHTFKIWDLLDQGLAPRFKEQVKRFFEKLLNGAVLLHCQVTQLRGDGGGRNSHRCACAGCAHYVGGWRLVLAPVVV